MTKVLNYDKGIEKKCFCANYVTESHAAHNVICILILSLKWSVRSHYY